MDAEKRRDLRVTPVSAANSYLSLLSQDFLAFLADRCIPKTRKGLYYYLDAVGVPEYDPVLLVEKTQGRMAEDHKWLEII